MSCQARWSGIISHSRCAQRTEHSMKWGGHTLHKLFHLVAQSHVDICKVISHWWTRWSARRHSLLRENLYPFSPFLKSEALISYFKHFPKTTWLHTKTTCLWEVWIIPPGIPSTNAELMRLPCVCVGALGSAHNKGWGSWAAPASPWTVTLPNFNS